MTESRPRRRRWLIVAGLTVAALLLFTGGFLTRGSSPVGHFTSADGHDHFVAAYEKAMTDLPQPAATLDIRTTYGLVRVYRFAGAEPGAEPLILLPGWAASSPMWADNLPSLLRLRTVYTVDLLGEPGASIQDRPIETHREQADWLHQLLQRLPEPRFHVLGMSFGGWTATNLVVHRPEKVAGLILIDPAVTFADLPFEVIVRSLPASVRWLPKSWRDGFNSWTAGGAPVEDSPLADLIESGMGNYAIKRPAPARFDTERLRAIDVPVLVIFAGESVMHDAREAARTASSTLRHRTVLTYDGASHAINGEQPDRIAADVAAFLSTTA
ncbi:alpha/beta fold hydrolase [Actinoplanes aureus]|uniref:Alpha/beta hydrolase n=1 Tax=Actinoplanes aureus TaxID=2792083 RepID=A0A931CAT9_9ACTN|nr:alpha/beta hydrolase [Actinoplanes aureus]MBG0563991.1 alpha/beta hydrolase [Actinoplanes aureus]